MTRKGHLIFTGALLVVLALALTLMDDPSVLPVTWGGVAIGGALLTTGLLAWAVEIGVRAAHDNP